MSTDRRTPLLAIFIAHAMLVPTTVLVTYWHYAPSKGLTISNQITWVPIVHAQCLLLSLFFALGTTGIVRRGILLFAGLMTLITYDGWSRFLFAHAEDPSTWFSLMRLQSVAVLMPTVFTGLIVLGLRPFVGTVRHDPPNGPEQFRMMSIIAVTAVVALSCTWLRIAMPGLDIDFVKVLSFFAIQTALAVGCVLLVLSRKLWWIGGIAIVASFAAEVATVPDVVLKGGGWSFVFSFMGITFGVLLLTLFALRLIGFELRRFDNSPTHLDNSPGRDASTMPVMEITGEVCA